MPASENVKSTVLNITVSGNKLHIGIDAETFQISLVRELSKNISDASVLWDFLAQLL